MEKGIKTTIDTISSVADFSKKLADALDDRKITLLEGFSIGISLTQLAKSAKDWREALDELKDLDSIEFNVLIDAIKTEFNVSDTDAKETIDAAASLLHSLLILTGILNEKK